MEYKKPVYEPRWMYHKDKKPTLVKSFAHEKALGEGWADSPAKHGAITHPHSEEYLAEQAGEVEEEFVDSEEEFEEEVPAEQPKKRGRPKKQE